MVNKKISYLKSIEQLNRQAFKEKLLYENIKILKQVKNTNYPIERSRVNMFERVFRTLEELDQKVEIINS